MNYRILTLLCLTGAFFSCGNRGNGVTESLQQPVLFVSLPDGCPTPDGMAEDADGNLVLACPNYARPELPGCLMKITRDGNVTKWFDVPVHPATGVARPMGIAFDDTGALYICDNQGWSDAPDLQGHGRVLKLTFDSEGNIADTITVADGMEHPNGVRVRDGKLYVTQSSLSSIPSEKLVSGIYRFDCNDRDIMVTNTLADSNLITTVVTQNPEVQYGLDGLVFDNEGNLYAGNFGDAAIHRITFAPDGSVADNSVWACDTTVLKSTDGLCIDGQGNIYVADFSSNAIAVVTPDRKISLLAKSGDCDGADGGLDQPGEPFVWGDSLIVSCFDLVTGPDKVNTGHDRPYTLTRLNLYKNGDK